MIGKEAQELLTTNNSQTREILYATSTNLEQMGGGMAFHTTQEPT
jgi:hypothetical protein